MSNKTTKMSASNMDKLRMDRTPAGAGGGMPGGMPGGMMGQTRLVATDQRDRKS